MSSSTPAGNVPPGWYPDPAPESVQAGQQRWWDGQQWTGHVRAAGASTLEKMAELDVTGGHDPSRIASQVRDQAGVGQAAGGSGTIFTEPVLVVNQRTKLIELTNEYGVFDQHGRQLGAVTQVGQSGLRKALRFVSNLDQYLTHRLEARDHAGAPLLRMTRPAKLVRSRMVVERGDGAPVGEIRQQNAIGKINFSLLADGVEIGQIRAENWRAWDFAIVDGAGTEVARITKTFEGVLRTAFTTADNYVVRIHRRLPDPLLSMVVASALTVDTALKQDDRGFG